MSGLIPGGGHLLQLLKERKLLLPLLLLRKLLLLLQLLLLLGQLLLRQLQLQRFRKEARRGTGGG